MFTDESKVIEEVKNILGFAKLKEENEKLKESLKKERKKAKRLANKKLYYRATEISSCFGIGLSTVWLYAKQGKLTPKKISEKVTVFSIDEIEKIINNKWEL